jgi:thiol:disulfide interchange protein DsbD
MLFAGPPARAQQDEDPFSLKNKAGATRAASADDPFSIKNKAEPIAANPDKERASAFKRIFANRIRFKAGVKPQKAKPGEVISLTVTGTPLNGNHTYPITWRTPEQEVIQLSRIVYAKGSTFQPLWPLSETKPVSKKQPDGKIWLEHDQEFTWTQDIYVKPGTAPGPKMLEFTIRLMVCDAQSCTNPGSPYPPFRIPVEILASEPVRPSPDLEKRLTAGPPPIEVVQPPADQGGGSPETPADSGLAGLAGTAFVGAILMLLTPCVFPMVPITVNFFLKQSEKEHHRALPTALVYAGTIILLLTLVIVALGKVIVVWANNPWFNLLLGLGLLLFALSLFGMFEIELPRGLARFTSAREGQGGYLGAVFMALTFTITSFTCTGPFLGAMLGGVAAIKPPFEHVVIAALIYSATFAAPFFLLALFPTLLKMLPKSGGWLNAIKVTMGFVELALALKFLANADFEWSPGNPRLFTYDSVLCAWIALSFACGLYLIGVFRLPHDEPADHVGVLRMVFASIFFGLTIYLTPALRRETPQGVVGEKIVAFLPPALESSSAVAKGGGSGAAVSGKLAWHLDYIDAWNEAVKAKDPGLIFIDFTGVTCTNCRQNETTVFPKPEVRRQLEKYVRVQLYTDSVPNSKLSAEEAQKQAERNSRWRDAIGDNTNPYYVIFRPDPKEPFDTKGNLKGAVLGTEKGTIFDVDGFVQFLQKPQKSETQLSLAK